MKNNILILCILLKISVCVALAQPDSKQCLNIDFESLAGVQLKEGMQIHKQFFNEYGVTFELENGSIPVLAKVGNPTVAFSSNLGGDTPMPDQNIGNFFITDDGFVSNLTAIPLIVRFNNPVDSVSAVVMDMDFDEVFTVDARDINDVPIFTKTIKSGDPGTGDGIATTFGFNLDGCSGAIYSLRFEGKRKASGGFGFAMDNFSFCFSGIDIEKNIGFNVNPANCLDNKGSIDLYNYSKFNYTFSLDGINYAPFDTIRGLPVGQYTLYVKDDKDCAAKFDLFLDVPPPIVVLNPASAVVSTSCGKINGKIDITANGFDLNYSLNGLPFQKDAFFENLSPGLYKVVIKDGYFCKDSLLAKIEPSIPVTIEAISTTLDFCEASSGSLSLKMATSGQYTFSIDGIINETGSKDNLKAGMYKIEIKDAFGCLLDTIILIESTPTLLIGQITAQPSSCTQYNGTITFSASGGTGTITHYIDGILAEENIAYDLKSGTYTLIAKDDVGCEVRASAFVSRDTCPIYIPNIISMQSAIGENQFFSLKTLEDYNASILRYSIYDRWGNLIFDASNFSIHDQSFWWDGRFCGKPVETDVYTYLVRLQHPNGFIDVRSGDVTLLK